MKNINKKKIFAFVVAIVVFGLTLKFFQVVIGVVTSLMLVTLNIGNENHVEISKMSGDAFGLVLTAYLARGVYRRLLKNKEI